MNQKGILFLLVLLVLSIAFGGECVSARQRGTEFCRVNDANKLAEKAGLQENLNGVRLLVNRQEVGAGDAVKARLANLSDTIVLSGAEFKIQRYDGTTWRTDPSSPDGPWPRSARKLKPGEVAGCYRYVVPEAQPAGRYRFLTSVAERTEQHSRTHYKASDFFIRGVPDGEQMPQSVDVTTSSGATAREARYQLEIQAGAEGAAFGLQYVLPSWPTSETVFGSPLKVTSLRLAGAGSIRTAVAPQLKPLKRLGCYRGVAGPLLRRFWIEMPANSTSVLSVQVKGTYPAWPQTRYGVSFSIFAVEDPSSAELAPLADINVPRLAPKGTHIEIAAQGKPGALTTPMLVGRTVPPFRHARISLRAILLTPSGSVGLEDWTTPQPSAVSLGAVQTDDRGRFRVRPRRLTANGPYAVIARSEARGARAADWNCGAFFNIH